MMYTKIICRSILHLSWKQVQTLKKVKTKIQLIKKLRQKTKFFLVEENLSAEEVKEAKVLSW